MSPFPLTTVRRLQKNLFAALRASPIASVHLAAAYDDLMTIAESALPVSEWAKVRQLAQP